jgi:hypothetical protein
MRQSGAIDGFFDVDKQGSDKALGEIWVLNAEDVFGLRISPLGTAAEAFYIKTQR